SPLPFPKTFKPLGIGSVSSRSTPIFRRPYRKNWKKTLRTNKKRETPWPLKTLGKTGQKPFGSCYMPLYISHLPCRTLNPAVGRIAHNCCSRDYCRSGFTGLNPYGGTPKHFRFETMPE